MGSIKSSSVAYMDLPYFSPLSHKRYDIREKKVVEYKMYVVILFATLSETIVILEFSEILP